MTAVIYYGAPGKLPTSDHWRSSPRNKLISYQIHGSQHTAKWNPLPILHQVQQLHRQYPRRISLAYKATPLAINEHTTYIQAGNKNLQGDHLSVVWNYKDVYPLQI